MMYSKEYIENHIGKDLPIRKFDYDFQSVERYFLEKCRAYKIKHSCDCTANENTYFDTLNYTTYAGMFIIHPLCFSESIFQVTDALADRYKDAGHISKIKRKIEDGLQSKYTPKIKENNDIKSYDAVIVLAGSNKIYEHTSVKKMRKLNRVYGSKAIVKPHPITKDSIIDDIKSSFKDLSVSDKFDDLYGIIKRSNKVYTTHISETALTAKIMGKEIEPIDPFGVRLTGSFSHINRICFSSESPLEDLASVFASEKSGVFYPVVDHDWKAKMDSYFEYIMSRRARQKSHYLE